MVLLVSYLFAGSGELFFHPKVVSMITLPGACAFQDWKTLCGIHHDSSRDTLYCLKFEARNSFYSTFFTSNKKLAIISIISLQINPRPSSPRPKSRQRLRYFHIKSYYEIISWDPHISYPNSYISQLNPKASHWNSPKLEFNNTWKSIAKAQQRKYQKIRFIHGSTNSWPGENHRSWKFLNEGEKHNFWCCVSFICFIISLPYSVVLVFCLR